VCPHAVLRAKYYPETALEGMPEGFQTAELNAAGLPGARYTLQVYAEDCTGCGLCVEACPVKVPGGTNRKAINLALVDDREPTRTNVEFFESIPINRAAASTSRPCAASSTWSRCSSSPGPAPAAARPRTSSCSASCSAAAPPSRTRPGCSSIYGGNLPTTPWSRNKYGRGPAWSNSLFEDNAEFGLGLRLAADLQTELARTRLEQLRPDIGNDELVDTILTTEQKYESDLSAQRARVDELKVILEGMDGIRAADLRSVCDHLLRRSVWIVGGDGWAYDIGSGGLDHVLASGRNVNVLVLDTEVYSNTGGQASKATPMGAVAKFASAGKETISKDLAMQAISYGNVYVARVAMGADPEQTLKAFREAEAYDGPSLILAYSHCIAHGIDMKKGLDQQYLAVNSGHWPLMRYNPVLRMAGKNPFLLDSPRPRFPLRTYHENELRFRMLKASDPEAAERMLEFGQAQVARRWRDYEDMSVRGADEFATDAKE
jgi:pyruvate-ferredoxin/flavodoxin oxidoreductase